MATYKKWKFRGRTITPEAARTLIVELFEGRDAVRRAVIIQQCEAEHVDRGGKRFSQAEQGKRTFKKALRDLKDKGCIEDAGHGYWHIRRVPPGKDLEDWIKPLPGSGRRSTSKAMGKKFIRHRLYGEQRGRCAGCGRALDIRDLELDHVVPLDRGGADEEANLQLLCSSCNASKGNKISSEWITR